MHLAATVLSATIASAAIASDGSAEAFKLDLAADRVEIEPILAFAGDFNGTTIASGGVGIHWFVEEQLSVGVFAEAIHVNQEGENAMGGGGGVLLRWHFARTESAAFFGEIGVGLAGFDSPVPQEGTTVDFSPRAAVGVALPVAERTTLDARIGWLHFSNAQTGEENPGIDALAASVGLHIAF